MIIGFVEIEGDAINTHRDSYILDQLTVVSVRRPFLPSGLALGGGLIGFAMVFGDLLYPGEIITLASASLVGLIATWQCGQLKLLSRDLRGTELSGAIWGRTAALNAKRRDIVRAIRAQRTAGTVKTDGGAS